MTAADLFGGQAQKSAPAPQGGPSPGPAVADVAARLKVLEQRYNNLTKREQLAEQNMLDYEKGLKTELKALQQRLFETRRHVSEIKEKLDLLMGSVANAVQRHELRELDAYLSLWQPSEFVTRAEAKKLLETAREAEPKGGGA